MLYSHRSTLLHTFAAALPDTLNISGKEVIFPVVPMFHVNAWGIPYAGAMVGAKLVFPGAALDGKSVYELIEAEKVTLSAGVPDRMAGTAQLHGAERAAFLDHAPHDRGWCGVAAGNAAHLRGEIQASPRCMRGA